jgi:5-oxopent-3-ene-1,2,5-tricarboxylate decarboxylase/2-hydroxyhepta-2,4-diene-1,7-dioate isomerase
VTGPVSIEELRPTKIVAIHLNYASRIEEFGSKMESVPSYFLKAPSSLSTTGRPVERPSGCRYLNYEGEIAIVIGRRARAVGLEQALDYVAGYTVANDFGVHDFRHADRGSMLRVKGQDGFCPIGPVIVGRDQVDPSAIALRTLVNDVVVQEGNTSQLVFPFEYLIADLSRLITLEPHDLILTGTPANSRPVEPGDVVSVEAEGIGRIENPIVSALAPLGDVGAMPTDGYSSRQVALGLSVPKEGE